jgi:hypothetical protein
VTGSAGPRVRGTRAARHGRAGRLRVGEIAVAALVAASAIAYAATQGPSAAPEVSGSPAAPTAGPSELAALAITGARTPLVAIVGADPDGAVVLPPTLTFTAPGQGEVTAADVAGFPGDSMRIAVSNAIGAWAAHYGVLDLNGLGRLVDAGGGIDFELSEPAVAGSAVLGPGEVHLDGRAVINFLFEADRDAAVERFLVVLRGLLEASPRVTRQDLLATDDAGALERLLRAARGADAFLPPTRRVAGTVTVPDDPAFDAYLQERFGIEPPTPAIVQNGSGEPAVGEAVARKLLPEGFRIVLSGNAESFDHRRTDVLAEGTEHIGAARRARRALGVGRVALSQVPSGIGDITIVVGKDFNG